MSYHTDEQYARELDAIDPLAGFRERFVIADPTLIYLDGNSLGRLPKASAGLATHLVNEQWGIRLIRGWNEGWFEASERIGARIATLIGADADEVIVADSTSINLFKLAVAAVQYQQGRLGILTDDLNFPSDIYVLQGVIKLLGERHLLQIVNSADGIYGPHDALCAALTQQTALLALSHTVFKSGYIYDMAALTAAAHRAGSLVLWDLSHSVGVVPVDLHAAAVDLAIGCTYKYLNGGPGAPAFLYIRRDLQPLLPNPIPGWMGQENPFAFGLKYQPYRGLRHMLTGTPPVLSLALIESGIELVLEAGLTQLRQKSLQQTAYLLALWEELLSPCGFELLSPRESARRGSHLSLGHREGLRIDQALISEMNVIPDFRAPDSIRLGVAPLYTSYHELWEAVSRLVSVVDQRLYERYTVEGPTVT